MASNAFNEEIAIEIKGLNEDTSKKSDKKDGTYGGIWLTLTYLNYLMLLIRREIVGKDLTAK